ncbi:MAG: asparagine synthase (glutamine-hydrolyzing) [Glaciimonas sp.]|nr:asparagine synthase (glutamine-hydrolyzing) [Glaciimonas sp.]
MCGISGILNLGNRVSTNSLQGQINAMNDAIAHRGPDGSGEFVRGEIALGHRRLKIIDLSIDGHQPMFNEDYSLVLVFNGEIYNYLELIPELKARGHIFRSHSDSEVILHGYEEWGVDCVQRFNGMWSFAIWDTRKRRLFASRDRLGVKPFYFTQNEFQFIFSSEIKGIAAVQPLHEADLAKVHDYLRYGYRTNDGATFFKGVSELSPGHNLIIENNQLTFSAYWKMPTGPLSGASDAELIDCFSALIQDAVHLRFRSDVPVALLQSGGLDSSAICRVVDDDIEAGRLNCDSVTAFTAIFPGFKNDESVLTRELIATCKHIKHVELTSTSDDLLRDLPRFVQGMGEPVQGPTSFAHWQIMRSVHEQGIKVIINGQGADEALAGYGTQVAGYRLLDTLLSQPWAVLGEAWEMRDKLELSLSMMVAQTAKAILGRRSASKWRARMVEGVTQVLSPDFIRQHDRNLIESSMTFSTRNMDQHLRAQIEHYGFNQILHYEDHSSMMSSIEMRSPFVDYRLMEFAFSLPDRLKFDKGITKRIQRLAFANRLPKSILDNHRKIGFATPFQKWMADPKLRGFFQEIVASSLFQSKNLWRGAELKERFAQVDNYPNFPFWRFINLELWARAYGITNL